MNLAMLIKKIKYKKKKVLIEFQNVIELINYCSRYMNNILNPLRNTHKVVNLIY